MRSCLAVVLAGAVGRRIICPDSPLPLPPPLPLHQPLSHQLLPSHCALAFTAPGVADAINAAANPHQPARPARLQPPAAAACAAALCRKLLKVEDDDAPSLRISWPIFFLLIRDPVQDPEPVQQLLTGGRLVARDPSASQPLPPPPGRLARAQTVPNAEHNTL